MQVYAAPASTFVAGFIGSPPMNMMDAKVTASGQAVELPGGTEVGIAAALGGGRPIKVGVRPEHMHVNTAGPLNVVVDLVEALGADTLVHGRIGGDPRVARQAEGHQPAVAAGDRLPIGVAPEDLHVFDGESGARLTPG